jgi:RNA polymerase primary sigma factor
MPAHTSYKKRKMEKFRTMFLGKYGKEPTIEEVAIDIKFSVSSLRTLELQLENMTTSIDDEYICTTDDYIKRIDDKILKKELSKHINNLTELEKKVIHFRFNKSLTLDETGKIIGFTRENIRLIQKKALQKMKNAMEMN